MEHQLLYFRRETQHSLLDRSCIHLGSRKQEEERKSRKRRKERHFQFLEMTSTTSPFFPSFLTSHTHTHPHTHSHTHVAFLLFFFGGFFFSEIFVASARRCGFLFLFFDPTSKIFFSNFLSLFCLEPLCFVASLQGAVDLVSSFHHIFIHFFSPFFLFFFLPCRRSL